jgi:hypothetical protein
MRQHFPLFQSHLDLAHHYWQRLLQNGGWAIDATCGNGKDTLKLAELLLGKQGGIIGIDIQSMAIDKASELLLAHLGQDGRDRIHLFCQSHAVFPSLANEHPIRLIVYNLGYLPRGDKQLTTIMSSTMQSVRNGLELIIPGGAISITCYPGHEEGGREERELLQELTRLDAATWNICYHTFPNRMLSASVIFVQKAVN